MVHAGQYLPGKGRYGKCRVVHSKERKAWQVQGSIFQRKEAWSMQGSTFQGEGEMGNAG